MVEAWKFVRANRKLRAVEATRARSRVLAVASCNRHASQPLAASDTTTMAIPTTRTIRPRFTGPERTGASSGSAGASASSGARVDMGSGREVRRPRLGDRPDASSVDGLARVPGVDVRGRSLRRIRVARRLLGREQLDPEPFQPVQPLQNERPDPVEEVVV